MKHLRSLIITLTALAVAMATGILVATKGWGLEPKSWWWILGGSFAGHMLAQVFFQIAKGKDDE